MDYPDDCFWRCVAYFKLGGGIITEADAEPFARGFFMWKYQWSEEQAHEYLKQNGAGMTTELLQDFPKYALEKGMLPISGNYGHPYIGDFNTCDVSSYECNGYRHAVIVESVLPDGSLIIVDPQNGNDRTVIPKEEAQKFRTLSY